MPVEAPAMLRHFVDLFTLTPAEAHDLIERAVRLKAETLGGVRRPLLAGRTLGLLFEKPSLRTRVSFEAAIEQLGGAAIFLPGKEVGLGERETVADFARVLSQYVDALAARTFSQDTVDELAHHASIPVINALSDAAHPCQAMADLMTVRETFGRTEGVKLVFVGDGNNVARSLAVLGELAGVEVVVAAPADYQLEEAHGVKLTGDPRAAADGADALYTDVWVSMGDEDEERRKRDLAPFRLDADLLAAAKDSAVVLHCLPAHPGDEITADVLYGPQSAVFDQAENRLHAQKALLELLLS
jgi:ornithine carbamoyltransferase